MERIVRFCFGFLTILPWLVGCGSDETGDDAAPAKAPLDCPADRFGVTPVDTGEVTLQLACMGSGRDALLLHGYPEFHGTWSAVGGGLVEHGFRVLAPDQRGYAGSDRPDDVDAYRLDHLVADVIGVVEKAAHAPVLLVGHDWGGVVAWTAAHRRPDLFSGLVILNGPHPDVWERPEVDPVQAKASDGYVPLIANGTIGPEIALGQLAPFLSAEELDALRATWAIPGAKEAMARWYTANVYPTNTMPSGNTVELPTLLVWGMDDPFVTSSELAYIPRFAPHLEVENLPGVGHWVQLEAASVVVDAIKDFTAQNAP